MSQYVESFTNTFLSKAQRDLNKLNQITDENTFRAQPTSKPTSLSICAKVIRTSRLEHPTQSTPFAPHPSPTEANRPLSVSKLISNRDLSEPQNFRVPSIFNSSQRCPQKITNPCSPVEMSSILVQNHRLLLVQGSGWFSDESLSTNFNPFSRR